MNQGKGRPVIASCLLVICYACPAAAARAEEIHSNGRGGGLWSDAATWRGKAAPGPGDDVVIARGDVVVFDRNDDQVKFVETGAALVGGVATVPGPRTLGAAAVLLAGVSGKTSCRQLNIDPKGVLTFKPNGGRQTICVNGPVESFGTIRLDARNQPNDFLELRLVGRTPAERSVKLQKGGALLVEGRANLGGGRRNVALTSRPQPWLAPGVNDPEVLGTIAGEAGTMIDVQRAVVTNLFIQAVGIDNTGAKPNERVNLAESRFLERSRLLCTGCDTPLIANNEFDCGAASIPAAAIHLYASPLAEVRGNRVRGHYSYGIMGTAQTDSSVTNNTIERCGGGIYWYGENGMIKQADIRGCGTGIVVTSMSGTLEDITVDGATTAFYHAGATAQLTNFRATNLAKDGVVVSYSSGPLTLLNCDVRPDQVKLIPQTTPPPKPPPFLVQALHYLVVGVKDEVPANTQVEVRTAQAAPATPGAADLNVRNGPALLASGRTPLPQALNPLIVKAWVIDANGKTVPAPEYVIRVLAPAAREGGERKLLKTLTVKPQDTWYRPRPNEPTPTLEVPLK